MSSYVFSLSDISIANNSTTVAVNNADSFFGLIEGSQLFIAGKLPATIIAHDTTARTLTLSDNWAQGDVNNVSAQVLPLGAVATLLTALENNRAAYQAFLDSGGGLSEVNWLDINNRPETATRWPKFSEVTETVSENQLPETVTANKRSLAESPPVRQSPSLTHILNDYPTLKKTVDIPTHSPNNRREMLFDDVRQAAYIALTEEYLKVPNVIATREFLLKTGNRRIRFNSNYTGNITLRVYPMGNGGSGLPNNPTLTDYEWHTITESVSNLSTFAISFVGIIDYIETDNGFETLSTARSHFNSIDAYYSNSDGSVATNEFKQFTLRQDGDWYSEDVLPNAPYSIGSSWSQDTQDLRSFTVNEASGSTDALRLFNDSWDDYDFEIVLVTDVPVAMAVTITNNADIMTFFAGTYRFVIEQERIYFKRQASFAPITGTVRIESLRLRVKGYE